ncbi:type II toxin-antitoxin system VapC family toxin [Aurantimonas sp. Leaf443]|uniref:type II toxin-antitoxin system VapC family toxin n=1 Tax=Aurantimonas sp. Leaf443 TaxID=1736378 RepID=UPI0006FD2821|nr:type II toxin-antitoxin system VapC family toxin [Aurantimonas sp. Leaf443]KQT83809.1 hypothetical protein ASG48_10405 [Aurantimonas sp. Leaf443]
MYLLDTMVISEGFRPRPVQSVVDWLERTDSERLFVSVVSFGEIEAGIEKQRGRDVEVFRRLEDWLDETQVDYAKRTLPVTTAVAMRWGRLVTNLQRRDMDLLIAATALEHDLVVATRNIRHFEPTGAKLFNPYEA